MNFIDQLEDIFDDEELACWLALDQMSSVGIGCAKAQELFDFFGSMKQVFSASQGQLGEVNRITSQIASAFVKERSQIDRDKLLETCRKSGVQPYPYYHPGYPQLLRGISDPPTILYVKGKLNSDHLFYSIGVVGTRKPTSYGRMVAKDIAGTLAGCGVTVVSGMAIGIDSLAHWGAIEAGGRTIAVLACGPDYCYPTSNKPLYEKLISGEHGAVVSEFFPGTRPEPWRFPARNRIISGLSRGVCVVEAGEESGALITAEISYAQGHVPFAVPGRIDSPMSAGTNGLIARNKATIARGAHDILRELNWQTVTGEADITSVVQLFGRENDVFEMISTEPVHFDHLCQKSHMMPGELSATLTMLELAGIVTRHPGDWYSRSTQARVVGGSHS